MKKILSTILSMILILSFAVPSYAQTFRDVPKTHYNYSDIEYLVDKGAIDPAATFAPADTATRMDVIVMLAKALKLDNTPKATGFKDVPKSHKYSGYIYEATKAGIINGYPDGTFKPDQKVTRGHMAAFIARAYKLPNGTQTFKDVPKGHTAYEAVKQLAKAGITTGYTDGTFKPQNNLTKAHLATFVARAVRYKETGSTVLKNMKVHFLDVGQGDSILIQTPNGKTILVDGGPKSAGDEVVAYLKSLKINTLDYVVATHPDADHIGGLLDVLAAFQVEHFIDSGKVSTTDTYIALLNAVKNEGSDYRQSVMGESLTIDPSLKIQVLNVNAYAEETNEASIVLKVSYQDVDALLTGDADTAIESQMMAKYNVESEILKAGHHGSSTSSSLAFLRAVKPETVILSYGEGNSYGHPNSGVLSNIKAVGAKAYSTAASGNIVITSDGYLYTLNAKPFENTSQTTQNNNQSTVVPGAPSSFANCTEMRKYYPNGVPSGHPAYQAKMDRDNDGWACEK